MVFLLPAFQAEAAEIRPSKLRCEYRQNPLGIDVVWPRLSWTLQAAPDDRGVAQSAYRVLVASTPEKLAADQIDLWDSGKVAADQQLHIEYAGKALTSRMRCYWKVRVWNQNGKPSDWSVPAMWSMGLLKPQDWQAQWIAAEKPKVLEPHNGYHSDFVGSPDAEKWIMVDLGQTRRSDGVRLWPARPFNWQPDTPGFLFPARFRIEVASQKDFTDAKVVADRTGSDVPNPGNDPLTCRFDPVSARYMRLTATRLRSCAPGKYGMALAEMQVLASEENLAKGAAVEALDSIEQRDWSKAKLVDGRLKPDPGSKPVDRGPATLLRKEFTLDASVKRATLHVTGLGLHQVFLNGRRVGDELLAPEFTKYERRVQYSTLDATGLLQRGSNVVGALLSDGWYGGECWGAPPVEERSFRGHRGFLMRLDVELTDGQTVTVVSDSAWRASKNGPIRNADLWGGEVYDARMEMPGWNKPGFNDAGWQGVVPVEFPGIRLVWQSNEPIRVTRELTPVKMTQPTTGVHVFDFGQNMVGWCRMKVRAPTGTQVTLQHGEMLKDDGTVYTANLRGAAQRDVYTCHGGGEEVFEPHFTYHGFRYVEIRGLSEPPSVADLTGRVFHSASPETGRFECSNPLVNQLMHNALWSQFGNMMSIPTDCPQRDERAGWMGDIQAFSQTAIFNMNMAAFFTKWLADVRDSQADDGRFSNVSPNPNNPNNFFSGAPAWADAGVVVPWRMYENYADVRLLEQHVESARRWVDFIHAKNPDLVWLNQRADDYGDWLNGNTLVLEGFPKTGNEVPKELLATAFWHQSARMVSKMHAVLGRNIEAEKYSQLADGIRRAFNRRFVAVDGKILGDTQAGYALALRFDLLDETRQSQTATRLVAAIGRYQGHLSTGIQSTHHAMLALSQHGHHDVADRLMNLRTVPSWGYTIDMGATTIWERWDGYVKGRGFQDAGMNSFNHWALGSVAEWVWCNVAGIAPDEAGPGYKRFTIAPRPSASITWARGEYESIRGTIRSDWRVDGGRITLNVSVPPNTTATIHVPTHEPSSVTESGRPVAEAMGVKFLRAEKNAAIYEVGSGSYVFKGAYSI